MNELMEFRYGDKPARTVERGGELWWVLAEVCAILGIKQPTRATERLHKHEISIIEIIEVDSDGKSRPRKLILVRESGLYKIISRSNKPEAEPFIDWVFGTVLPSIRKTGKYELCAAVGTSMTTADAAAVAAIVDERLGGQLEKITRSLGRQIESLAEELIEKLLAKSVEKAFLKVIDKWTDDVVDFDRRRTSEYTAAVIAAYESAKARDE